MFSYLQPQSYFLAICFVTLLLSVLFGFLLGTILSEQRLQPPKPKRRMLAPRS